MVLQPWCEQKANEILQNLCYCFCNNCTVWLFDLIISHRCEHEPAGERDGQWNNFPRVKRILICFIKEALL